MHPRIVARQNYLAQTASVTTPTTIYTSPFGGMHRIAGYITIPLGGAHDSSVDFTFQWIDEFGNTISMGAGVFGLGAGQFSMVIHTLAGTDLQFTTFYQGNTANDPYNLYFTVEEL